MPIASSSLTSLAYVEEPSWGATPAGPLNEIRWTGESLVQSTTSEQSNEVRADRQIPGVIRTGVDTQGDINVELSYGAHDDLLAGALMDDWSTAASLAGTDLSTAASDNSLNSSSTDLSGIMAGQWLSVGGFANGANNGYFQAVSVGANKVVVAGGTLADEASGASVTLDTSSMLRNGVTAKSFTVEKAFTDLNEYVAFTGMRVASVNLSVETSSVITGAFSFQGKQAAASGSSVGSGSATAAPSNPIMSAVDSIEGIRVGGELVMDVSSHSFTVDNTLRAVKAQGSLANIEVGLGTLAVTGSVSAYFTSRTLYEKHLSWETSSFSFRTVDAAGNAYVFTFPALKFTDGNPVAGGKDQDILVELQWTAFRDPSLGYTVQIDRFPAP